VHGNIHPQRLLHPLTGSTTWAEFDVTKFAFGVNNLEAVHVIREITELKALHITFFLIEGNNGNVIQIFQTKQKP